MRRLLATFVLVGAVALAGCGNDSGGGQRSTRARIPNDITVSSSAFADGQPIPERYTCEGDGLSPPLEWKDVPDGAAALALVVADPDAPGGTFYHWVVTGIDAAADGAPEGQVPAGGVEHRSSSDNPTYIGMCPPDGDPPHHYRFTVYALTRQVSVGDDAGPEEAVDRIEAAAVGQGTTTGTYKR